MSLATAKILRFAPKTAPLAVLIAIKIGASKVRLQPIHAITRPELVMAGAATLAGADPILKWVGRQSTLYAAADTDVAGWTDHWLDFARAVIPGTKQLAEIIAHMDDWLTYRTFFAGSSLSIADLALFEALTKTPEWTEAVKTAGQNVRRWWNYISGRQDVRTVLAQLKDQSAKAQDNIVSNKGSGIVKTKDIELAGAVEGKVVTRFPPAPSGFMHVGHAKAALLNDYYAKKYKGKMLMRFDDTNPSNDKPIYEVALLADVDRLGIKYSQVSHTSDHFETIMSFADKLVAEGKAYVDDIPQEVMRDQRMNGIESASRSNSIEVNKQKWAAMKAGKAMDCVLRGKFSMTDNNKCMRDPVYYRCNTSIPHARTGNKYVVYPTYDFACPIVDSIEGVTHALRTSEFKDRDAQYARIIKDCGIRSVDISDYSRLNFEYTCLSKRKLGSLVDQGVVDGWDDPRFPTVQGLLRRGLTVDALRSYIIEQGSSKRNNNQQWSKLWTHNRRILDLAVPRFVAIAIDTAVKLTLTADLPGTPARVVYGSVPLHKKVPEMGTKLVAYSSSIWIEGDDAKALAVGEEVTLMDWGNAIIRSVERSGDTIKSVHADLNIKGDFKTTSKKLTWLADIPDLVPVQLHDFGHIITKPSLEDGDDFMKHVNKDSRRIIQAWADPNLRSFPAGECLQFERRGFYRLDSAPLHRNAAATDDSAPYVFFSSSGDYAQEQLESWTAAADASKGKKK